MSENNKNKQAAFGCLFWIACILLIILLFFLKRNTISAVLKQTGFFETIFNSTTEIDNTYPDEPRIVQELKYNQDNMVNPIPLKEPIQNNNITIVEQEDDTPPIIEQKKEPITPPLTDIEPIVQVKMKETKLFFIQIDKEGKVLRKNIIRNIPISNAPLTDTLKTLFQGPEKSEQDKDLITLIPSGTKLISVSVKDGLATLNISEDFLFNQFGIEGYLGQLMQVVFTATEFPTVSSVQILIEGQRKEYLSGDGIWIGTPLTRDNF